MLNNSQKSYFAIDLSYPGVIPEPGGEKGLRRLDIGQAEKDGTLQSLCSTYSPVNDRVYDGCSQKGSRIVTFAPILKSHLFPLAEVVNYLLRVGAEGLNCPVEIEFAIRLYDDPDIADEFFVLQIRPMSRDSQIELVSLISVDAERVVAQSINALGNMHLRDIADIVYVTPETFEREKTVEIGNEVGTINDILKAEGRRYLLVGPGRWGTAERWLGIPVLWKQISHAKVIVEASYGAFAPDPSFGTHFFHNLISMHVGYFTVNEAHQNGTLNWDWLLAQEVADATAHVRRVKLAAPMEILIDGRSREGVILRS